MATKPPERDRIFAWRRDMSEADRAEFEEMPHVRLTFGQVQRLFGLRTAVCERVLAALVSEGTLTCTRDQRYGLRD